MELSFNLYNLFIFRAYPVARHDPCIVPRIIPVAEAMLALVLADALIEQGKYE